MSLEQEPSLGLIGRALSGNYTAVQLARNRTECARGAANLAHLHRASAIVRGPWLPIQLFAWLLSRPRPLADPPAARLQTGSALRGGPADRVTAASKT